MRRDQRRLTATIASVGLRYFDAGSWLHTGSVVLLWLSIPVGVIFACLAHRFSIVEGCAGEVGYEDLDAEHEDNSGDGRQNDLKTE